MGGDRTFTTNAPPTPGLSTSGITAPTPTGGTLNGRVDPNGFATSAYVEYGTSAKYGSRTPTVSVGSGEGAIPLAITVTGLKPLTRYFLRFVVINAGGTKRGTAQSFTTPRVSALASLGIAPNPLVWGGKALVIGSVVGTGAAGARTTLTASPLPFTAPFADVAATDSRQRWRLHVLGVSAQHYALPRSFDCEERDGTESHCAVAGEPERRNQRSATRRWSPPIQRTGWPARQRDCVAP